MASANSMKLFRAFVRRALKERRSIRTLRLVGFRLSPEARGNSSQYVVSFPALHSGARDTTGPERVRRSGYSVNLERLMSVLGWYDGPLSTDPETPIPNEAQENQLHMQRGPAVHPATNGAELEDEPQPP